MTKTLTLTAIALMLATASAHAEPGRSPTTAGLPGTSGYDALTGSSTKDSGVLNSIKKALKEWSRDYRGGPTGKGSWDGPNSFGSGRAPDTDDDRPGSL